MPEMVKVICLRSVRVSDDGIRNRLIEPGDDLVDIPADALAGLIAEGYVADPSDPEPHAAADPASNDPAADDADQGSDSDGQALALKHVGFGSWVVVDGDGNKLTEPMTKAEAAAALAAKVAGA